MSADHVLTTIELIQKQIAELDQDLLQKKRMVNDLCGLVDRPPLYDDADLASRSATTATRPDEYYGKPLATAVRMVLEKRQAANLGAATVPEIYDEMSRGGYHFTASTEDNNKRALYTSLGKNTTTFHKLPNGTYGLREWYQDIKEGKSKGKNKENGNGDDDADASTDEAVEKPLHEELQEESSPIDTNTKEAVKSAK